MSVETSRKGYLADAFGALLCERILSLSPLSLFFVLSSNQVLLGEQPAFEEPTHPAAELAA